jgi:hypothetical protein
MSGSDLYVAAFAVAVTDNPDYRPVSTLDPDNDIWPLVHSVAALTGIPRDYLEMRADAAAKDTGLQALRDLGMPAEAEPLFLVRPGPPPDPYVAVLARLVEEVGWPGEDTGITHLDEAGGTAVFDLLDWATPPDGRATALIVDEPLFADMRTGLAPASAVAVRVCREAGPARVLGWGEGEPPATSTEHEFTGTGPCAGWLQLHAAAQDGLLRAGDHVLIRAAGGTRTGWVLLEVAEETGQ